MNRKMFALLLLLPVAVFATEKIASSEKDGGNKEKRKTEATQPAHQAPAAAASTEKPASAATAEAPAISNPPQQNVQQAEAPQAKPGPAVTTKTITPKVSNAAAVAEYKAMQAELEGSESEYYADGEQQYSLYGPDITDELAAWLKKHVKEPLTDANPMGINVERSYSRCPSGYHVVLVGTDGVMSNEGWMVADDGCWDRPLAKFRYDIEAKTVVAMAGKSLGFIPLNDFLKICKAANS